MNKFGIGVACLLTLAACNKKNDLNTENITSGMNAYLAKRGDLCLAKNTWPIDVTQREIDAAARNAVQMPVLEKVGLVSSSVASVDVKNEDATTTIKVNRYELTDAGKKYYLAKPIRSQGSDGSVKIQQGDFCPVRLSLDKVVGWEASKAGNSPQEIVVNYTYKVDAAPWTQDAEVQKVFPVVAGIVRGAGSVQLKEAFNLTQDGWVAQDL